jgi:hypothetical protein
MASFLTEVFDAAESVSKFAPDRFRATVMNGLGLASASRFKIDLPSIGGMRRVSGGKVKDKSTSDDRNMLCTAVGIPGKSITTINRSSSFESTPIAVGHTLPEVNFTFYLTNVYTMREYFHRWMQCVTTHAETNRDVQYGNHAGYYKNYSKDVKIVQYTRNARKAYSVKLIDAYPTTIGIIELNSALQTQPAEVTVTMQYRAYWTSTDLNSPIQG